MASEDIRLQIDFFSHTKTIRLRRKYGAVLALIRLWCWAARHRPSGDLGGLEDRELERIAEARPGTVAALVEVGFLAGIQGKRLIHDWADWQPWVVGAPARTAAARAAAAARWANRADADRNADRNAESMRNACGPQCAVDAPTPNPPESEVQGLEIDRKSEVLLRVSARNTRPPRSSGGNGNRPTRYSQGFLQAWERYPHYGARSVKRQSWLVWCRRGLEPLTDQVLHWIEVCESSADWQKGGGEFVRAMQVWLKQPDFREDPEVA